MGDKPGWKTSEFWITSIGVLGGLIMSQLPDSSATSIVGSILAAICGGSYSIGRSLIKSKRESGRAIGEALARGKKKDPGQG